MKKEDEGGDLKEKMVKQRRKRDRGQKGRDEKKKYEEGGEVADNGA